MFAARSQKAAKAATAEPLERKKTANRMEGPVPVNPLWSQLATRVQAKVAVSAPDDPYEREADRVADHVMRMPEPIVQRACVACGSGGALCPKCEDTHPKLVQRQAEHSSDSATVSVSDSFVPSLGAGRPLDATTRSFMESRFGRDFRGVRVHTDTQAGKSARTVQAVAYTLGSHIAFAEGKYMPSSTEGRRLLAHELTHVVQQSGADVGRQNEGVVRGVLQRTPECARPASCPNEFCLEFPTKEAAKSDRDASKDRLLSLVGKPVLDGGAGEVRKLYSDFLDGGRSHQDLSSPLAPFFTKSSATGRSIRFLDRALEAYFRANPPPRGDSTTVDIRTAIPSAVAALGSPGDANVMAFRNHTETPGVLAGGVGQGQAACPVGAIPSTVEDHRTASGTATGTNSDGTILVSSSIEFSVTDTLDFCPGNCGGSDAQEVTVPLSRYEATGISGDVPFTVTFPAPIGAFDSE